MNPGTAAVTVTGKGNYTGTARGTFAISSADVPPDEPAGFAPGIYAVTPAANESVTLDVSGAGGWDGANVQLYSSNRTYAQMFCFRQERDGVLGHGALLGQVPRRVRRVPQERGQRAAVDLERLRRAVWYVERFGDG